MSKRRFVQFWSSIYVHHKAYTVSVGSVLKWFNGFIVFSFSISGEGVVRDPLSIHMIWWETVAVGFSSALVGLACSSCQLWWLSLGYHLPKVSLMDEKGLI